MARVRTQRRIYYKIWFCMVPVPIWTKWALAKAEDPDTRMGNAEVVAVSIGSVISEEYGAVALVDLTYASGVFTATYRRGKDGRRELIQFTLGRD